MVPCVKTGDNSYNPHVKTLSLSIGVANTILRRRSKMETLEFVQDTAFSDDGIHRLSRSEVNVQHGVHAKSHSKQRLRS